MVDIQSQPKPDWAVLPRPGCSNVEFRVLMQREGILVANLRFATHAEIDEHDAPMDIDVLVLSGAGYVSVDGAQAQVRAGQTVRWPAGKQHKLWTTTTTMETIMVERLNQVTDD